MKILNADDLKKEISKAPVWTALAVKEMIDNALTVDIVRCSECRWWTGTEERNCTRYEDKRVRFADDYCSYGTRSEE